MQEITINSLPATTAENIILLIDALKKKNSSESAVKALFGKGESVYSTTKSALKTFEFVEADGLTFTSTGREIAYSQDNDKKVEMIKVLKNFPPYEVFLLSLINKDDVSASEIEEITNFWAKAEYGSKQRNRDDAAKLFMSIIDYCDFGKYVIGRGSNPTRIEWAVDIKKKIETLCNGNITQDTQLDNISSITENIVETTPSAEGAPNIEIANGEGENFITQSVRVSNIPNISINVDMGDWPDEKIKAFFKYAYGKFEEE